MASSEGINNTFVVARYFPKGNVIGKRPFDDSLEAFHRNIGQEPGSKRPENAEDALPETGECSDSEVARWFL